MIRTKNTQFLRHYLSLYLFLFHSYKHRHALSPFTLLFIIRTTDSYIINSHKYWYLLKIQSNIQKIQKEYFFLKKFLWFKTSLMFNQYVSHQRTYTLPLFLLTRQSVDFSINILFFIKRLSKYFFEFFSLCLYSTWLFFYHVLDNLILFLHKVGSINWYFQKWNILLKTDKIIFSRGFCQA